MVVGRDTCLHVQPMDEGAAQAALQDLLQLWLQGHDQPLPLPFKTGLALALADAHAAVSAYEGGFKHRGECEDMSWQRLFPDYEALASGTDVEGLAQRVYAPLHAWCDHSVVNVGWGHPLGLGDAA